MNTTLDIDLTEELQANTIAVSMKLTRFGNSKKLDENCHEEVARVIDANIDRIKATEVIVNSKHPAYKAVTSHMSKAKRYFVDHTVTYPEPTIRLLNAGKLNDFNQTIEDYIGEMHDLVDTLDSHRDILVEDARIALGKAFKPEYYPTSFRGSFSIEVSYPSIGPDERLKQLNPGLYEEQERRFKQQMEQAISDTTTALAMELEKIFTRISESVSNGRTIRSDMFNPLNSFLERFEDLRLGSSPAIREVVDRARDILNQSDGVALVRSATARANLASALAPLSDNINNITQTVLGRRINLGD